MNNQSNTYPQLIESIGQLLQQGRRQEAITENYHIVHTYWEIGRYIASPHLISAIDEISNFVLANVKDPSESNDHIVLFLKEI